MEKTKIDPAALERFVSFCMAEAQARFGEPVKNLRFLVLDGQESCLPAFQPVAQWRADLPDRDKSMIRRVTMLNLKVATDEALRISALITCEESTG